MKETLTYILQQLVDKPDDVSVEELNEESRMIFKIHANQDDIGKIIGKNGRIIRAIRDLIKLMATRHNVYVDVVLAE